MRYGKDERPFRVGTTFGGIVALALLLLGLGAGPAAADDWVQLTGAQSAVEKMYSQSGDMCASASTTQAELQLILDQIRRMRQTWDDRLHDGFLRDLADDGSNLGALLQGFANHRAALQTARGLANIAADPIDDAAEDGQVEIEVTEEILRSARQMLDSAEDIHGILNLLISTNRQLATFRTKGSYSLWMAVANYRTYPDWYNERVQAHLDLWDVLDDLRAAAYRVFGNRVFVDPTPQEIPYIYRTFTDLRREIDLAWGSIISTENKSQAILVAIQTYPDMIKEHRARLAAEAKELADEANQLLTAAKRACIMEKYGMAKWKEIDLDSLKNAMTPLQVYEVYCP